MLLGVDVGGTFTDAVLFDGETVHTAKLPTTPEDQSIAVIGAVEEVLRRAGAAPGAVESFAHGMTVGTNALLEERGARTALIATEGFASLDLRLVPTRNFTRCAAVLPPTISTACPPSVVIARLVFVKTFCKLCHVSLRRLI